MFKEKQQQIDRFFEQMMEENQIPGAVYSVFTADHTLMENAVGLTHSKLKLPMTKDTVFDLASLTKVCATLPSILLFLEAGEIDLDDPVKRFFPETFQADLTLKHLLTHTSGLTWHVPFYTYGWSKERIKESILTSSAIPGKEVVYSDLNFILLGFLVEKLSGQSLDQFTQTHIYEPLHMSETGFNPNMEKERIAPTEFISEKEDYQWGVVHDENAEHLGGVSGHAGLFSTVGDLKKYVRMQLKNGMGENGERFLSSAILKTSRRNFTSGLNLNRGIGWQLVDEESSPLGYLLSPNSYGHTGFTGTSFWIDPDRQIGAILLSNRVHISRAVNMNRVRRIFHNLVASSLEDF